MPPEYVEAFFAFFRGGELDESKGVNQVPRIRPASGPLGITPLSMRSVRSDGAAPRGFSLRVEGGVRVKLAETLGMDEDRESHSAARQTPPFHGSSSALSSAARVRA